jgi:3'(2'), 5'-bisphosphate nucleotidase
VALAATPSVICLVLIFDKASSFLSHVAKALLQPPDNLLKQVSRAVCEAGQKIIHFYQGGHELDVQRGHPPLTAAERASHCFLSPALRDIRPEIEVVSEESVDGHCNSFVECESCWLLDPLDGTKEFIKGTNEFAINVALIESGQPVLGVIHAPALGLTYYGLRRSGAWRQTGDEPPKAISSRRAGPSQVGIVAIKDHIGPFGQRDVSAPD